MPEEHSTDLGEALTALGRSLTVPDVDLASPVRTEIEGAARRDWSHLAMAAAVVLAVLLATLAIAPARQAIADWLGIGRTSVEIVDTLPSATSQPPIEAASETTAGRPVVDRRVEMQQSLTFPVRLPDESLAGPIVEWETRPTGDTRELVVQWERFALTQRPDSDESTHETKLVAGADSVSPTIFDGIEALWIEGAHVRTREDTRWLSASVLLWVENGVEFRLEGELSLEEARQLASSVA